MSHYVECAPGFKDREALVEALIAVDFDRGQIEMHEEAVPLYGYQWRRTSAAGTHRHPQAARRPGRQRCRLGAPFRMARICAWISEYDSRHRFNPGDAEPDQAGVRLSRRSASATGTGPNCPASSMLDSGEIEVVIGGYR